MILKSPFNFVLTSVAVVALMFCFSSDANAQGRGFRIGNIFQAGGGQGFRLGGPRAGMHFGGGQGASIGGQNLGMRFGNGQGARFGSSSYGMQFGGQQGTQFGRFSTVPTVAPGTYYYGDVQNPGYAQPAVVQSGPVMIPATVVSPNDGIGQASFAAPTIAGPAPTPYQPGTELATQPVAVENAAGTTESTQGLIRLRYPAEATQNLEYSLNGSALTLAPGETVTLNSGQQWTVQFSAGEEFGKREAKLSEAGELIFKQTSDEGWVLVDDEKTAPVETQVLNPTGALEGTSVLHSTDAPTTTQQPVVIDEPAPSAPTEPLEIAPAAKVEAPIEATTEAQTGEKTDIELIDPVPTDEN